MIGCCNIQNRGESRLIMQQSYASIVMYTTVAMIQRKEFSLVTSLNSSRKVLPTMQPWIPVSFLKFLGRYRSSCRTSIGCEVRPWAFLSPGNKPRYLDYIKDASVKHRRGEALSPKVETVGSFVLKLIDDRCRPLDFWRCCGDSSAWPEESIC